MDKPGNPKNKTITIKINGKDRPIDKEKSKIKDNENHSIEDIRNPRYEELENIASWEAAASQEAKEEDEFDWILPEFEEDEEIKEYKIVSTPIAKKGKGYKGILATTTKGSKKKTGAKGILPSVLLTVFLAVLLGSSLGVLMLKMVISESATETGTTPVVEETPVEEPSSPGTASLDLPSITSYIVQGGAFSTTESADTEAATMAGKGLPTKVIQMDDKSYLFVGIADNLENAKAVGVQLQNSGVETFAKESVFGGASKTDLQEGEKKLLEFAPALYEKLAEISSSASLSNSISAEQQEALNAQFEQWNKIEGIQNENIGQLKSELDKAVASVKSYGENNDSKTLVEIQQHLLNFIAIYHSL